MCLCVSFFVELVSNLKISIHYIEKCLLLLSLSSLLIEIGQFRSVSGMIGLVAA